LDAALQVGRVFIVEWLRAGDQKTGWQLFDVLQPVGLMSTPDVLVSFTRVNNRVEFVDYLRSLQGVVGTDNRVPLLHVDAHGSDDGLGTGDDDEVLWPEMMELLTPLNERTGLRLSVVLAACHGLWGLKMAQPATRAAFLALLGPNREITNGETSRGFLAFYQSLFATRKISAALRAMNDAVDPNTPVFQLVDAEMLFKDVWAHFVETLCRGDALERRIDAVVVKGVHRSKVEKGGMWAHEVERLRVLARRELEAVEQQFVHYRRQFFFIDLFPDNDRRFPITLQDCNAANAR
jgi:hypothetical protein